VLEILKMQIPSNKSKYALIQPLILFISTWLLFRLLNATSLIALLLFNKEEIGRAVLQ